MRSIFLGNNRRKQKKLCFIAPQNTVQFTKMLQQLNAVFATRNKPARNLSTGSSQKIKLKALQRPSASGKSSKKPQGHPSYLSWVKAPISGTPHRKWFYAKFMSRLRQLVAQRTGLAFHGKINFLLSPRSANKSSTVATPSRIVITSSLLQQSLEFYRPHRTTRFLFLDGKFKPNVSSFGPKSPYSQFIRLSADGL